jgi:glycosyltransferase involved in cell wall biosynthesis
MSGFSVLHIVTSLNGGAGIAAGRLSAALSQHNIQSDLLSLDELDFHQKKDGIYLTQHRNQFQKFFSSTMTFLQSKLVATDNLLLTPISISTNLPKNKILKKYNVLHIHSFYNLLSIRDIEKLSKMKIPIVITMHDERLFTGGCHYTFGCDKFNHGCKSCPQSTFLGTFFTRMSAKLLDVFSKLQNVTIITPSNWLAEKAKRSIALSNLPIYVVRNPIPSNYFETITDKTPPSKTIIGFCSIDLNNPYKGVGTLIKAANLLCDKGFHQNFELQLIGGGTIKGLDPRIDVKLIPSKSDFEMCTLLKNLSVLIIPSLQDNSPSVLSEALAVGIPVIGSRIGGISEILENFRMSSFEPLDFNNLASILESFILREKSTSYSKIKNQAFDEFSFDVLVPQFVKIYEDLLKK